MAVEAMTSVTRLLEEVPLSPDERAAAEGDMAAYGLAVQMGVVVRERLQLRFQRFVYPGANRQRAAAQSAMLSIALPCHRANRRSLFTNAAARSASASVWNLHQLDGPDRCLTTARRRGT
jgi:hypothetical protein